MSIRDILSLISLFISIIFLLFTLVFLPLARRKGINSKIKILRINHVLALASMLTSIFALGYSREKSHYPQYLPLLNSFIGVIISWIIVYKVWENE